MLRAILGARLGWLQADGWVFDPVIVGPDDIEYTLAAGPHAGRHAIQRTYYQRVAPGIETTAWYEESGAVVHVTWYLESQTSHRFGAIPAWLARDFSVYRGDNQDPAFLERIHRLAAEGPDRPRHIFSDDGYFEVL
ncbi:phenolic acid decarboxylase [Actinopolymorpha pittospori]|uniref:Phenolic acid decarboxylase n=1 Tax=Actinopolymorpha pittospori TaxID=648752 RepID=A0A927N0I4_9ACTN|nr:phenolic acid decarboxylase [Actinopolymorpha pittospori]MBE1606490.1 phenolic acid decarboxylase [Actinopolymorpha pittospori]